MKIKLGYGDCLELMKKIPDGIVDMCLTDPPYGTTACKWDNVIPFEPMWEELKRIVKPNGAICLFGSEPFSSALRMSNIKMFKYDWIWNKKIPSNIATAKYQPMKYHEIISVFYSKNRYFPQRIPRSESGSKRASYGHKYHKNAGGEHIKINKSTNLSVKYNEKTKYPSSILEYARARGLHPTQKPVPLLEYLIKTYTLEGETVLDFTMGSGSTGVAAKNLNRSFIGIEKDENYYNIAKERIGK